MNSNLIVVQPVDIKETQKETNVSEIFGMSQQVVIKNQADYEDASTLLRQVKDRYKTLDERRKEITSPMDSAKKVVMDLFRSPLDMLQKAEEYIKTSMIAYKSEQDRKAREIQRKIEEEAEKKAATEREKIEAQERKLREKQEELMRQGKAKEAAKMQEKADQKALDATQVEVAIVPVISAAIETPRGISYSDKWTAEVIDIALVPRAYLIPNMEALNGIAKATKGSIVIPGIKFNSEKILSSRR